MPDELERIHDKLDDQTVKLTELGTTMKLYMLNQNALNDSLTKGLKDIGSEVVKMKLKDASSTHQCAEEIKKHEESAWSHNPKKAIGIAATLLGLVEGIRGFFHFQK